MSHRLLPKKCWLGLILLPSLFLILAYAGLDFVEHRIRQAEIPIKKAEEQCREEESNSSLKEAATRSEEALNEEKIEIIKMKYPCKVQMVQGCIGVYVEENQFFRELKQMGEYLSDIDLFELQKGIWVKDEQELIMLLESFHLH